MKKYGRVKLKNPSTEGHTVRLLPFQGIELLCDKKDPLEVIDVSVKGDLLFVTNVFEDDGVVVCTIEQKFDMTEWSKVSTTFMGNICLTRTSNGQSKEIRLCVYCEATSSNKSGVLTVIQPDDFLVKIDPHQLIQIVMYGQENLSWTIDSPNGLKCVRCETVVNDFQTVYDTSALFCPQPRSNRLPINSNLKVPPRNFFANESFIHNGSVIEYHFWCCLSSSEIGKLHRSPNGTYQTGTVTMTSDDKKNVRTMRVMLNMRGNSRKINVEHFKGIHTLARCWSERSLSYARRSLFNPGAIENLDVAHSESWFYVEIPSPSIYYSIMKEECRWHVGIIEKPNIHCQELKSRFINGKEIQRFLVTGIKLSKDQQYLNLGGVHFCANDSGMHKKILLNFWKNSSSDFNNSQEVHKISKHIRTMTMRIDVELEVLRDGILAEDSDITLLRSIDSDEIYYSEYSYIFGDEFSKKIRFPYAD